MADQDDAHHDTRDDAYPDTRDDAHHHAHHHAHREVEVLAIGAGPSNLALAVALEELAPPELASSSLVIERSDAITWQRGLLLPDALSQVSFLKDLVTQRDPTSRFSFINHLHATGRLDDFVNMGSFAPYRIELSAYLQWVAASLEQVRVEVNRSCRQIEPCHNRDGGVDGWLVRLGDDSTIGCRHLVVGVGRAPHLPAVFANLPASSVVHSTEYVQRIGEFAADRPYRVAVIGGAQSAAEMFAAVAQDLPRSSPTLIMRSIGLNTYESSKFTNELYYPSFVDEFFRARPDARRQLLVEMHRTNYAGLAPGTLEQLYRQVYLDRLNGQGRLQILTMRDITAAEHDGEQVLLTLTDRKSAAVQVERFDLVLLGTGFARTMPPLIRDLGDAMGLEQIAVDRRYRLALPPGSDATCHLQGVNEATHGIADSLLSVLATRAHEIAEDIFAQRASSWAGLRRSVPDQAVGVGSGLAPAAGGA